jgi:hypothetical protein
MSRPRNVGLTVVRHTAGLVRSQIPVGVRWRRVPLNRPLSGTTKHGSATATATNRRLVPTPGSITARCTVRAGKAPTMSDSKYVPARMFRGAAV